MSVSCECCVLSGTGTCDELITRSKESYRLWCVVVCDLKTLCMKRPRPALGGSAIVKVEYQKKAKYELILLHSMYGLKQVYVSLVKQQTILITIN
jgi:hypothetical protein